MVFLFLKEHDLPVTLRQHCQSRRLDTPHIQGAVVEDREKTGGIDPHQPIRLLPAKGRLIETVILRAGAQVTHALTDRHILHRGNPEAFHRLVASGHFIHQPEDQFPFAPRVTGIDNRIHIRAVHQSTEIFKSILLTRRQHIAERLRQDGEVVIAPLLETLVITRRIHGGYQMPHTPGNDQAVSLKTAIGPGFSTQGRRDRFCYTRFFCDN